MKNEVYLTGCTIDVLRGVLAVAGKFLPLSAQCRILFIDAQASRNIEISGNVYTMLEFEKKVNSQKGGLLLTLEDVRNTVDLLTMAIDLLIVFPTNEFASWDKGSEYESLKPNSNVIIDLNDSTYIYVYSVFTEAIKELSQWST